LAGLETVTASTGDPSPLISSVPSKNRARYSELRAGRGRRGGGCRVGWLPRSPAAEDADLLPIALAAAAFDEESGIAAAFPAHDHDLVFASFVGYSVTRMRSVSKKPVTAKMAYGILTQSMKASTNFICSSVFRTMSLEVLGM
jgi:hypothetical protein